MFLRLLIWSPSCIKSISFIKENNFTFSYQNQTTKSATGVGGGVYSSRQAGTQKQIIFLAVIKE
jgi:hypothetical protein